MANAIKVSKKAVAHIVRASGIEYSGRTFRISTGARVMFYNTHWSEGSRNTYVAVRLSDGARATLDTGSSPWTCPSEGSTVELPTDIAIVEHSIFCGKDSGITIHVHPDCQVARLLPGARPELTAEERTALLISYVDGI